MHGMCMLHWVWLVCEAFEESVSQALNSSDGFEHCLKHHNTAMNVLLKFMRTEY